MKPWLILDCHFLLHRAFHTTGELSFEGKPPTGTIFGFMRALKSLRERFQSDKFIFCFDCIGKTFRERDYPWYKEKRRRNQEVGHSEEIEGFRSQITLLRDQILGDLGYMNIFKKEGLEADDLISLILDHEIKKTENAVIVSADKDLYQLLTDYVHIFNPITNYTLSEGGFRKLYGLGPDMWPMVKAIAGCSSDEIPGIEGIGEKTAILYCSGKLPPGKKLTTIIKEKKTWEGFLRLTQLPYPRRDSNKVGMIYSKNDFDEAAWDRWCKKLGFTTAEKSNDGKVLFREKTEW